MNPTLDKEKLTAYVLGELEEKERLDVAERLLKDAAARRLTYEIRMTAEATKELFTIEEDLALNESQRQQIRQSAAHRNSGPRNFARLYLKPALIGGLASAAVLLILGVFVELTSNRFSVPRGARMAEGSSPEAARAKAMLEALPEGAERFAVGDINNPAGTPDLHRYTDKDLERPEVQAEVAYVFQEVEKRAPHLIGSKVEGASEPLASKMTQRRL
ncbi:MAG: hypothetical protein HYZ00_02540, partial [Candidatus Hydrogenedentes bacterium]|nr:hypothetical protein [Candidatus Hydrogenedentota bacterium]